MNTDEIINQIANKYIEYGAAIDSLYSTGAYINNVFLNDGGEYILLADILPTLNYSNTINVLKPPQTMDFSDNPPKFSLYVNSLLNLATKRNAVISINHEINALENSLLSIADNEQTFLELSPEYLDQQQKQKNMERATYLGLGVISLVFIIVILKLVL